MFIRDNRLTCPCSYLIDPAPIAWWFDLSKFGLLLNTKSGQNYHISTQTQIIFLSCSTCGTPPSQFCQLSGWTLASVPKLKFHSLHVRRVGLLLSGHRVRSKHGASTQDQIIFLHIRPPLVLTAGTVQFCSWENPVLTLLQLVKAMRPDLVDWQCCNNPKQRIFPLAKWWDRQWLLSSAEWVAEDFPHKSGKVPDTYAGSSLKSRDCKGPDPERSEYVCRVSLELIVTHRVLFVHLYTE